MRSVIHGSRASFDRVDRLMPGVDERRLPLPVSITQKVSAYAVRGISRGHITTRVTVTNEGNAPILDEADALSIILTDGGGNPVLYKRTDSSKTNMRGPIPIGESFDREAHIDTAPLDTRQQYKLTCKFDKTGDADTVTFSFALVSLESEGQPPFGNA